MLRLAFWGFRTAFGVEDLTAAAAEAAAGFVRKSEAEERRLKLDTLIHSPDPVKWGGERSLNEGKNFAKEEKAFASIMAKEREKKHQSGNESEGTTAERKKKGEGGRQALRPRVLPDESSEFGAVT